MPLAKSDWKGSKKLGKMYSLVGYIKFTRKSNSVASDAVVGKCTTSPGRTVASGVYVWLFNLHANFCGGAQVIK